MSNFKSMDVGVSFIIPSAELVCDLYIVHFYNFVLHGNPWSYAIIRYGYI
jgi:hypothetical protein